MGSCEANGGKASDAIGFPLGPISFTAPHGPPSAAGAIVKLLGELVELMELSRGTGVGRGSLKNGHRKSLS